MSVLGVRVSARFWPHDLWRSTPVRYHYAMLPLDRIDETGTLLGACDQQYFDQMYHERLVRFGKKY